MVSQAACQGRRQSALRQKALQCEGVRFATAEWRRCGRKAWRLYARQLHTISRPIAYTAFSRENGRCREIGLQRVPKTQRPRGMENSAEAAIEGGSLPVSELRRPGAARIHSAVRAAILDRRLQPGARLPEDELASIYGVSRTIVRSALQALAHDRVVTIEPNRGAQVA